MTKYTVNKWLNLIFILLFIPACQDKNNSNFKAENNDNCSPKNSPTLTDDKIQKLNLEGESVKESGLLNKGEVMGFSLNAKAGDILKYKTDQDLCIHIYAPNNDLVKGVKLPLDGLYTLQVYLPKGLGTFDLEMSLNEDEKLAKKQSKTLSQDNSNSSNNSQSSTIIDVNKGISLIENLYDLLSEKRFDEIINFYSDDLAFQFNPNFFSQFNQVTVENLSIISKSNDTINLIGNNTYFYPDGSTQIEERSYQVMNINDSLIITDSQFIKVTKFR